MAETVFRGPSYSAGAMLDGRIEIMDGPGLEYQANAFPDVRYFPTRKDGLYAGRVKGFLNSPFVVVADNIPSAAATTTLAAAQAPVAATPLTLTTVAPGGSGAGVPSFAPSVPLIPFLKGASSLVTVGAIDFGFTTGNTTAGTASIVVPDSTLFALGQWICIGGVGNAAKTLSLMTQVIASADATHITVSPVPSGTLNNAPIGNANVPGPLPGSAPTGVDPYTVAGLAACFNPIEGLARNVSITANAGATGQAVTVRGYDIFGMPMTEVITAVAASTVWGKKAFKYIASITPATTDGGHTLAAGLGDTFGLNLRSDKWEFTNLFYNGGFVTTSAGWLKADATTPATGTTGDVRGTVQVSTGGAGGTGTAIATLAAITNGVIRLTFAMTIPLQADVFANPQNAVPLYGQTQF